jgi:hypothetical protein
VRWGRSLRSTRSSKGNITFGDGLRNPKPTATEACSAMFLVPLAESSQEVSVWHFLALLSMLSFPFSFFLHLSFFLFSLSIFFFSRVLTLFSCSSYWDYLCVSAGSALRSSDWPACTLPCKYWDSKDEGPNRRVRFAKQG